MINYVELRFNSPLGQIFLSDCVSSSFDMKYNDLGALEFTYPTNLADSIGLGDQSFVSVHVGFSTGTPKQVEEYIIDQTSAGPVVDGEPTTTFAGPSILSILNDALVYPSNWPGTQPSGHEFVEQTIGTIFRTLLLRARNRGTLTDLIDTSFTGTKDSSGANWTHIHTKTYENGKSYFAILQEMMEQGLVDVWMDPGLNLRIVNGGTRGSTISIDTVEIRPTKNISDLSITTQSGEAASALLMEGEDGALVEVEDNSFESTIGRRREHYVAQPGIGLGFEDLLTALGEKSLETTARIPAEESVGIANTEDLTPFQDFNVGDWIYVRYSTDEPAELRRVRQLAVSVSEQGEISLGATLGTIIHESDVALARKFESYAGSGGSILNNGVDNTVPNPPHTLGITSLAYTTNTGVTLSSFNATWIQSSTNIGGSAYTDANGFFVNWRYTDDSSWHGEVRTDDPRFIVRGLTPGKSVEVSVVSVDATNHRSTATKKTHTLAADATPPPKPAAPTAASRLGTVQVFWSGLTSTGAAQPNDFAYAEVHELDSPADIPVPNGPTRVGTFVGGDSLALTGLAYNTTRYFKILAVDRSGNWSVPSNSSPGVTVKALVDTDLIGEIIAGANLLPGTVTHKNLAIGDFENLAIEFDQLANRLQYPNVTGFSWAADFGGAPFALRGIPTTGTLNHHKLIGEPIPVNDGDEFWVRVELLRNSANFNIAIGFRALSATGTVLYLPTGVHALTLTPGETSGAWSTHQKALKVLSGVGITHIVPEIMLATAGTTPTGNYGIRSVTLRRRNEGNLIVDGTITGSKIQALEIATGHLAANAVTAMKIDTGAITADKIHLSAKGFAVNDNSSMEEDAGLATGTVLNRPAYYSTQVWASSGVLGYETASPIAGTKSAKVTVPGGSSSRLYYLPPGGDYIPVTPGEKWFVSARVKRVGGGAFVGTPYNFKVAVVGCTSTAAANNPYPLGGAGEHWGTQVDVLANGTSYLLTSVFVVPAGHTRLGMQIFLPSHTSSTTWVIDDFVVHPAIDDSKVTDITPGKITTGEIAANTRIIAGNATGARAEMNAGGFAAYNAAGAPTFTVSGSTGAVWMSGAFTTVAGSGSGRVEIAAVQNPYQLNQTWNTIRFFSNNANWTPGMIWAAYGASTSQDPVNWGALQLAGPKLGTRNPARITLRSEEQTNETEIHLTANVIRATADSYYWGDPNSGVTSFILPYSGPGFQRFNFVSQSPSGKRMQMRFEEAGNNVLASLSSATSLTGMIFRGRDFKWEIEDSSSNLMLWNATGASNRPILFGHNTNAGLVFGATALHVKSMNGAVYVPIEASAFTTGSDARIKENIAEAPRTLEVIESVPVYTYDLIDCENQPSQYGIMAQDLQRYIPEAVTANDEGVLGVNLSHMTAMLWGALQDLTAEVRDIQNPYSA